jgi:hypothetical protein
MAWENGRLFRKKEDQDRLLEEANRHENEKNEESIAIQRVQSAQWRREERLALANARRRARALGEI